MRENAVNYNAMQQTCTKQRTPPWTESQTPGKQTEFLVFLMLCLVKSQQLKAIPYLFAERVVLLMKLSTNAHNDRTVKCKG